MKRYTPYLLFLALSTMAGCQQADIEIDPTVLPTEETSEVVSTTAVTLPGVIRVCFTPEMADRIESSLRQGGMRSLDSEAEALISQLQGVELRRVFSHGGKYEARRRKAGLHLWYDIYLTPAATEREARKLQAAALSIAKQQESISVAELVYDAQLPTYSPVHLTDEAPLRATAMPYNDPRLPLQWHYSNDGSLLRSAAGADINLFEAWKEETGKRTVIVSVVDGGVDVAHEDLRDNLYVNTAELNGTRDVDDDHNGYVDDIYGYNFAAKKGAVSAHDHGTHVAGTVAARTNNGIGVAGIAGGDGSTHSGVRIMSCQVFSSLKGEPSSGGFEDAIVYGADNGAVISQNSWGSPNSTYLSDSRKAAIDYFIANAGCDEHGNQRADSPMKGGVVIFAAGNEGRDYLASPSSYPGVVAVSSMSFNYTMAYYSNRGTWVDIMAPGGCVYDQKGQVLSTLPDNQYGYMQGTSMACPHVSGIAALMVSKFGGPGFTAAALKERLIHATKPQDINTLNPDYQGRLGNGFIDAYEALREPRTEHFAPAQPATPEVVTTQTKIEVRWKAVADQDDTKASTYKLFFSTRSIDVSKLNTYSSAVTGAGSVPVGGEISRALEGATPLTTYYFAIVAYDKWGNASQPTLFKAETKGNASPAVSSTTEVQASVVLNSTPADLEADYLLPERPVIRLTGNSHYAAEFTVTDPEGNTWDYALHGNSYGAQVARTATGFIVNFRALAAVGKYFVTVKVTDQFGGVTLVRIPFEIYKNEAPVRKKTFGTQFLAMGGDPLVFDLDEYFGDANADQLIYTIEGVGKATVKHAIEGSKLTIQPLEIGKSSFIVTATDPLGAKITSTLVVEVASDAIIQAVYPNPADKELHLRVSTEAKSVRLTIRSAVGHSVKEQEFSLSQRVSIVTMDISSLASGNYLIEAKAGNQTTTRTFIKR